MGKRSSSKQHDPVTYFTDRDLGPTPGCDVVRILRASGMLVEPHNDHFQDENPPDDHEWLRFVANRGWVGLTHDKRIRLTEVSTETLMTAGAKVFVCIGEYPFPQIAENIVNSRHRMDRFVRKLHEPFIACLYMASDDERRRRIAGEVRVKLTRDEWLSRRPRRRPNRVRRGDNGGAKTG